MKMLLSIREYSNTNKCVFEYMPRQEMGVHLNLSCQGVGKEIRIKKHDQNANLCLIIATD